MPDEQAPVDPGRFADLQRHTNERLLDLPKSANELCRELRILLVQASNKRKVTDSPAYIHKYVSVLESLPPQVSEGIPEAERTGAFCIAGGAKNQNRDRRLPHFERKDGAWFDFSIVIREEQRSLKLLAYDFEIRFPPSMGAPFLRFDLNLPGHHNVQRELRCHLHPGSDDVLVPAPLMSPSEVLALFIDGARPLAEDRKPRTLTGFEVGWLEQTLERCRPKQEASATEDWQPSTAPSAPKTSA